MRSIPDLLEKIFLQLRAIMKVLKQILDLLAEQYPDIQTREEYYE